MLAHGMCKKAELRLYTRVRRDMYLISDLSKRETVVGAL
jgi:hypothetical protein